MKNYPAVGVQIPDILLPNPGVDLFKWSVIACDQFTSEPEYWQQASEIIGAEPSTLRLILPEVYLGTPEEENLIESSRANMNRYLEGGTFEEKEGMILVERSCSGRTRCGLMLALDLERYDFSKGSQSLIRATEGTILERLPPRMRIREGALLELPHILVLVDDPGHTVIEPVRMQADRLEKTYDFDLMLGSGHLRGWRVPPDLEQGVIQALEKLADVHAFQEKYQVGEEHGVLLFAMGDGNHSLATAKAIWEKMKPQVGMNHPARYALVEVENVHDAGLVFEPIHRVVFDVREDVVGAMQGFFGRRFKYEKCSDAESMEKRVHKQVPGVHTIGLVQPGGFGLVMVSDPSSNLPVGTLQGFLDDWLKRGGTGRIDYVHGADVVMRLGSQEGSAGLLLPAMPKSDLFKTVILDGALPRKTFSMGEAIEKRFYLECRRIL